ncbi:uncharacterized protein LOC124420248 [Lucilia cuprina]|uniref:uncharacterized protein LOC124420248 n=1 Tax=Lucilia cuprina TaxID=7375 RepID=UPI001F06E13B|nr:uncharacterized protein LOC124420248 [Lucilia cuprina]
MYTLESSAVKTIQSDEDEKATSILESTCKYRDGRFEIGLPWRSGKVNLPESYNTAYKRSICLEKKMSKDVNLRTKIEKEIKNLVDKGYARKLNAEDVAVMNVPVWYLPIFVVSNPNKPHRIRMVWDAAAKSNGVSLNDFLLSGPDLLTPLIDVLLAFRIGQIALCGDIAEMFHQILVRQEDTNAQRFLWWNEDDVDSPSIYVMNALSFGLNCAPCIAHFVRNKNADRFETQYPRAVKAVKSHHYVDDLIDSVDSEEEAKILAKQVSEIHDSAGFRIRNWSSNSIAVLEELNGQGNVLQVPIELGTTEKVLGVYWDPTKDVFKFMYKFPRLQRNILSEQIVPTKREVLKVLMSIYDPMGFVSCYTIGLKILLQTIWRSGIAWDDELPPDLIVKWQQWKENLPLITSLEVPRCYSHQLKAAENIQLHTFVDAGELGYSAICYLRIQCNEDVSTIIVMAKSKVAPLKPVSIPRLELQAAVLGIRLAQKITKIERIPINSCYWWSDSKTVLRWLRMDPRKMQQFVMHRVSEIQDASEVQQWKWVPSKFNPADLATKVTTKVDTSLWLNGPDFLLGDENGWPQCNDLGPPDMTEVRSHDLHLHTMVHTVSLNTEYFSDWRRLYRALATFLLYLEKLKSKCGKTVHPNGVTYGMICEAKSILYKEAQSDVYSDEICCLKLDDDGLLKVRGRTEHLSCHKDVVVLPRDHNVTMLLPVLHSKTTSTIPQSTE